MRESRERVRAAIHGKRRAGSAEEVAQAIVWLLSSAASYVTGSVLAVSGALDQQMGGSLVHVKNREFFFDHTSKDTTKYDSRRRSLYLPVVRNHLYDVFELFDFHDPSVLSGDALCLASCHHSRHVHRIGIFSECEIVSLSQSDGVLSFDNVCSHRLHLSVLSGTGPFAVRSLFALDVDTMD